MRPHGALGGFEGGNTAELFRSGNIRSYNIKQSNTEQSVKFKEI